MDARREEEKRREEEEQVLLFGERGMKHMEEEEERKEVEERKEEGAGGEVLALVGQGAKSPLLMLPSRFKGIFATLIDETLQVMDSKTFFLPSSSPSSSTPSSLPSSSSPISKEAEFRASLFKALDNVVASMQQKQIQQLATPPSVTSSTTSTTTTTTISSSSGIPSLPSLSLPPLPPLPVPPRLDAASFGASSDARVHSGFKEAYLSVRPRLLELLNSATQGGLEGEREGEEEWEILTTGHSLGGALASLCAHDLSEKHPGLKVAMYNFGAPRLGNSAFTQVYREANGDSYRVVNEHDAFARFPRNVHPTLFNYDHAGKTVLLNNATYWVEKEKEVEGGREEGVVQVPVSVASTTLSSSSSSSSSTSSSFPSSLELEPLFLEAEWQLLNALLSGAALTSHLEHRYFESLLAAHVSSCVEEEEDGEEEEEDEDEEDWTEEGVDFIPFPAGGGGGSAVAGGMGGMVGQWFRGPLKAPPLTVTAAEKSGGSSSSSSSSSSASSSIE